MVNLHFDLFLLYQVHGGNEVLEIELDQRVVKKQKVRKFSSNLILYIGQIFFLGIEVHHSLFHIRERNAEQLLRFSGICSRGLVMT